MLRIKDPSKSLSFYRDVMGMTLIDKLQFPDMKFDLYFLSTLPAHEKYELEPGSDDAHRYLWTMKGTTLELTHNYGTESDASFKYHPGNQEKDGFGHVAFNCNDVYESSAKLEAAGISFKKKPDEGRMKGLAFVFDPDGYWVELVKRSTAAKFDNEFNLSQTMLRIKDPKKSIPFYQALGMTLCREVHMSDFSLYFLACLPEGTQAPDPKSEEASEFVKSLFCPVLELTHNHGTEGDETFAHFSGNEADRKGFGHIGFLVEDVQAACEALEALGSSFVKRPLDGTMKGLAFAKDPDGYWIEVIKRGGYDDKATPFWREATPAA
uniref:Lactoylglutathione lyase n=1 Tax=Hanusia phi TaxID=3032 RepID=A0A7S0EX00_9CRYP